MSDADRSEGASWWALACRFLDLFAAEGAGHPNLRADDRFDAWMLRVHRIGDLLDAREAHEPWPWPGLADALEALVEGDSKPGDAAHAVAWPIDERFARTFPDDWIAGGANDGFDLSDGDLYPVLETPWSIFQPFLSRPASMSDPRPDELPHARRFRASELHPGKVAHVRIHPVTALLRDVLTTLTSVATAHPNLALEEFQWPTGARIWPVTLCDEARQLATVTELVGAALDGGSRLIVLPELSATAATIAAVCALLDARYDDDEDPALVLVGSRHLEVDGACHVGQDLQLPAGRRSSPTHRPDADRRRQRPADRRPRSVDRPLLDDGPADRWSLARVLAARGTARFAAGWPGLGRAFPGRGATGSACASMIQTY